MASSDLVSLAYHRTKRGDPSEHALQRFATLSCEDDLCSDRTGAYERTLPRRQLTQDQLLSAVRAAAAGLRVGMPPAAVPELDHRTVAVLRLIADGAGTREISSELGYSERTIKTVIAEAVRGLGARNRAQPLLRQCDAH